MEGRTAVIPLLAMVQLAEAIGPDDNWTGVIDKAERKKRQNRLNRRASRRRRALQEIEAASGGALAVPDSRPRCTFEPDPDYRICIPYRPSACAGFSIENAYDLSQGSLPTQLKTSFAHLNHPYSPDPNFPLSCDHLITVVHYNVWRACLYNVLMIGLGDLLDKDCQLVTSCAPKRPVPPNLYPTPLQQQIAHPSWIDLFPDPKFRDNMIMAHGQYDEMALFKDLIGDVCTGTGGGLKTANESLASHCGEEEEQKGVIVWSRPWDTSGWELTPGFIKRWALLLDGCDELIASSNRWRAQRDEGPLKGV